MATPLPPTDVASLLAAFPPRPARASKFAALTVLASICFPFLWTKIITSTNSVILASFAFGFCIVIAASLARQVLVSILGAPKYLNEIAQTSAQVRNLSRRIFFGMINFISIAAPMFYAVTVSTLFSPLTFGTLIGVAVLSSFVLALTDDVESSRRGDLASILRHLHRPRSPA